MGVLAAGLWRTQIGRAGGSQLQEGQGKELLGRGRSACRAPRQEAASLGLEPFSRGVQEAGSRSAGIQNPDLTHQGIRAGQRIARAGRCRQTCLLKRDGPPTSGVSGSDVEKGRNRHLDTRRSQ